MHGARNGQYFTRWLLSFRYAKVIEDGDTRRYSSLILSNIPTMSKVIKLSQQSSVYDGKFEVNAIHFGSKLRLIGYLMTAALIGLHHDASQSRYKCRTTKPLAIQLDGEVYTLDADSTLVVESDRRSLRCVL